MAKSKMRWYDWILSLLGAVALISIGTIAWFNGFNMVEWLSFGVGWLYKTLATIVAVLGIIGLITLVSKLLMK